MHSLNKKQKMAVVIGLSGQNLFITGEGGTGKSFLEETLVEEIKKKGKNVICMAFTGMSAQLMPEGVTIHSVLKCGIGPLGPKEILPNNEVLKLADVIIVDEISQVRMDLFVTLIRAIKKAEMESGRRKQLIVIGDFYQLAPVISPEDRDKLGAMWGPIGEGFCFQRKEWQNCCFTNIVLDEPVRQNRNSAFYKNINMVRTGEIKNIDWFNLHCAKQLFEDEITLCVKNDDADEINRKQIDKLNTRGEIYDAQVEGEACEISVPRELLIKIGMRVMTCINNRSRGYMNGDRGTVIELRPDCVKVRLDSGKVVLVEPYSFPNNRYVAMDGKLQLETIGYYTQIPIKPAYARV